MSLSLALSNAVSGLRATTAQTELISNNVSNALTDGYGRRDASLSAMALGGQGSGVRVDAVVRAKAPAVNEAFRMAHASSGDADTRAAAMARLAKVSGEPGDAHGLTNAADAFDIALSVAVTTPESPEFLSKAVSASKDYAGAINRIAAEAMALRTEADQSIAGQVQTINETLHKVDSLNAEIKARAIGGGDTSALEDQRDRLIKKTSSMIPVRVVEREFGEVALFAKNGAQLLDDKVFELGFTRTAVVMPHQSIGGGGLSGITVDGKPFPIGEGGGSGLIDGGSLAAAFEMRDKVIPEITATLDDLAADLIMRTQGLPEDPTLSPGDAGLFTDDGGPYNPIDLVGVSLRIKVNAAVDPAAGGELYRMRDGIGAAAPGDVGASAVLRGLQDAMTELRPGPIGGGLTGERGAAGFAAEFSSHILMRSSNAEAEALYRQGASDELKDALMMKTGVDTDQELSRLLVVEQAYAANARVVQVVDSLLEILTNLK